MHTQFVTRLALGAVGLAALTTASLAQDFRPAPTAAQIQAAQRTGSIATPRAYTSSEGNVVVTAPAPSQVQNTLHLFGARLDNSPY